MCDEEIPLKASVDSDNSAGSFSAVKTSNPLNSGLDTSWWACFFRRDLIPIKIFYFMIYGGLGMIVPYTPIFLKQLGHNAFQIGLNVGIRQLLGSLSGIGLGLVADRLRIRRLVVFICLIGLLGCNLILYLMPYPTRIDRCSTSSTSDHIDWLNTSATGNISLTEYTKDHGYEEYNTANMSDSPNAGRSGHVSWKSLSQEPTRN